MSHQSKDFVPTSILCCLLQKSPFQSSGSRLMEILNEPTRKAIQQSPKMEPENRIEWASGPFSDMCFMQQQGFKGYLDFLAQDDEATEEWMDSHSDEESEGSQEACQVDSWAFGIMEDACKSDTETEGSESEKEAATEQK